LIVSQENAFVNQNIFEIWAEEIFFPHVQRTREELGYPGWGALILDGFAGHKSETFAARCQHFGICLMTLPAHSSDQTQPLDLGTFGLVKKAFNRLKAMPELSVQRANIVRIFWAIRRGTDPINVVGSFERAGISSWLSNQRYAMIGQMIPANASKVRKTIDLVCPMGVRRLANLIGRGQGGRRGRGRRRGRGGGLAPNA
jgi:hypothetical protein